MAHKGIHSRGYLPHWDFADSVQAITFRLADSLPNSVIGEWKRELKAAISSSDEQISRRAQIELHRRISIYEDAGHGSCLLGDARNAKLVQDILTKGHGSHYKLIDWCIMPNHVHVLIRLLDGTSLGKIIKHWKAPSAVLINESVGRTGAVWMADCYDRMVRGMDHLYQAKAYIRNNPVKAGLCEKAEEWEFSSVGIQWSGELIPPEVDACGMNSALPVSGSSLSGHLHLRCDVRPDGVPFIAEQNFRAPIHLSKSHLSEGQLVVSVINPTAGFFDGDRLDAEIHVSPGAGLVVSTPSASRVYRTRSGTAAVSSQRLEVGGDASLEWIPEPFIPHAGAKFVQRTFIDLHPTASLLYFDWIAPGRVAAGEVFVYDSLRWEFDLKLGGALIARERCELNPGNQSLEALKAMFPAAHYLTVYVAGEFVRNWPAEALDALNSADCYLGHGPLTGGVFLIRALCRDSLAARDLMETLRPLLYAGVGRNPPSLGRIFC
jgi:urease accessory protein